MILFFTKSFSVFPLALGKIKIKQFPRVATRALVSQSWLCYGPATFQSLSCAPAWNFYQFLTQCMGTSPLGLPWLTHPYSLLG